MQSTGISQGTKTIKREIDEWINKVWYIQTVQYYSMKKNKWTKMPWKDMDEY